MVAGRQSAVVPVVAVALALALGAALIRLQGVNPGYAYRVMFESALFTSDGLLTTLQKATPLIFAGLAVAVALKVGLFNIGAEGQVAWGAVLGAVAGASWGSLPAVVLVPLCLLVGVAGGAVWAAVAGALKAWRGVHEVISTIMLNSIAAGIIGWLVTSPWRDPSQSNQQTRPMSPHSFLGTLGVVPSGFLLAVVLAVVTLWVLRRTTVGFRFMVVGANREAAGYAGIGTDRVHLLAMAVSGGLAGLGGAIESVGVVHNYTADSNVGLGFDGITIALLARTNPVATIPAALLVAALRAGAGNLQFQTGLRPEVVDVLLAITLLLVSLPLLGRMSFGRRRVHRSTVAGGRSW